MTSKSLGWKTTSNFLKAVLRSPWVSLLMLEMKLIQIPTISLLSRVGVGGLGGGKYQNKANSVSFQLKFHV